MKGKSKKVVVIKSATTTKSNKLKHVSHGESSSSSSVKTSSKIEVFSSYAAALPGTVKLFTSQKKGNRGLQKLNQKHSKRNKSIVPTLNDYIQYKEFVTKLNATNNIPSSSSSSMNLNGNNNTSDHTMAQVLHKQEILKHYENHEFMTWLWSLQTNHNLLFYGVGSKLRLLKYFVRKCLDGEDVLMFSGKNNSHEDNSNNKSNKNTSNNSSNSSSNNSSSSSSNTHQSSLQVMKALLEYISKSILKSEVDLSDVDNLITFTKYIVGMYILLFAYLYACLLLHLFVCIN